MVYQKKYFEDDAMIFFENPNYLFLLLLLLFFLPSAIMSVINLKHIFSADRLSIIRKKTIIKYIFYALAFSFLVFALANPLFGTKKINQKQTGTEVFFLLDISRSMNVTDTGSSRLQIAKALIKAINAQTETIPSGLVLFKGAAVLSIPLTLDKTIFDSVLSHVTQDSLTAPGSNLEKAIETAVQNFSSEESIRKVMVILTDGDESIGKLKNTVALLNNKNITVLCIGIGTQKGSPIKIYDEYEKEKTITTNLREENIKAFIHEVSAEASTYFRYDEPRSAENTAAIIKKINAETERITVTKKQSRTTEALLICFFCLVCGYIIGEHEWIKKH